MPNPLGNMSKGKKAGFIIGGVGVTGFLIYREVKKNKQQQAAAAAAAQTANSASSGYGYGYGYGMPPSDYYGYGESGGFQAGYYGYGTPEPSGVLAVATTTNAQWTQAALTQLQQNGTDAGTAAAALGAYIAGAAVTPAQQTIIQEALAIEGYPPQSGANGYPPSINVQGTTGGGSGGGQTGNSSSSTGSGSGSGTSSTSSGTSTSSGGGTATATQTQAPNVVGQRADQALTTVRAAGFTAKTSPFRNPLLTYIVTGQSQSGNSVTLNVAQHTY
jgi:hypothetical protein